MKRAFQPRSVYTSLTILLQDRKVKLSNLGVLLFLAIIFTSSMTLALSNVETSDSEIAGDEELLTINLIKLALSTHDKANLTVDFASTYLNNDLVVAEAKLNYTTGEELLTLANATLHGEEPAPEVTWGNYTLANSLALDAMRQFKAAMTQIITLWEETDQEADWRELSEAIQRSEDFVAKITELVEKIKQEYSEFLSYNFTLIDEKLNEASQQLAWAKANMTTLRINLTVTKLGTAKQSLDQISAEVKKIGELIPIQGRRISLFIDEPLKKLIQRIEALAKVLKKNLSEQVAAVMNKIHEAENLVLSGDLKDAMSAIQEAHRMLMELAEEVYLKPSPPPT
jgi:uncharacterized protein YqgV (UPF0045/DUF77 family)